jgi:hypothetical protein
VIRPASPCQQVGTLEDTVRNKSPHIFKRVGLIDSTLSGFVGPQFVQALAQESHGDVLNGLEGKNGPGDGPGSERRDARDGAAQDQGVHVVRALVGVNHLQVHQVARDAEFVANPVAA